MDEPTGTAATDGPPPAENAGATRRRAARVRGRAEAGVLRTVAMAGAVGVATLVAALLGRANVEAWIVGLVAALITLVFVLLSLRIRPGS
jgi:hypothetical protein